MKFMSKKIFDVEKFTEYLYSIMEENKNHIENGSDGEGHCEFENEVLDNVISFMQQSNFYKKL